MTDLIFATNNLHKLEEIRSIAGKNFLIKGLSEYNFTDEVPEDYNTLEANASQKAWYIYNKLGKNCFADDTGLEVEALSGAPGVFSARYSRIGSPVYSDMPVSEGNIRKLLEVLENEKNRNARFRTVISLIFNGKEYIFEGVVNGDILMQPSGTFGFGYDPVFRPSGYKSSFAEMSIHDKNRISHRAAAMRKMMEFLNGS